MSMIQLFFIVSVAGWIFCGSVDVHIYKQISGMSLRAAKIGAMKFRSPIWCVTTCSQRRDCFAVRFSNATRYCSYHGWYLNTSSHTSALKARFSGSKNDRIVLVKPIPVLFLKKDKNATEKIEFSEAGSMCGRLGGRLATITQLKAAWECGYHKCACGWVADGSAYLASHNSTCHNVTFRQCSADAVKKYHVYCTTENKTPAENDGNGKQLLRKKWQRI